MTQQSLARSATVDAVDRRIIRGLQLRPRVGFVRLGEVLGLSEQATARRYRRLVRSGVLRIFGVVNPKVVGEAAWHVRVRCRPDAAESLANALARRDDIVWVGIGAAGAEVLFVVRSLTAERREALLTRTLPRTSHVLDISAAVVLHYFTGLRADDWGGLADHLTAEEDAALRMPPGPRTDPRGIELLPTDVAILDALQRDGRATYADLGAAAGISPGRVARRLGTLIERRAVTIDADIAAAAIGFPVHAYLFLRVSPSRLQEVGESLAERPEVGMAAAISGTHNLLATLSCRSLFDVYTFTTEQIGRLDGVRDLEVGIGGRVVKQSGGLLDDGRLVLPAD
ncbi:Lrp/AsnC family transcriptional regulator [Phycicoccus endophyticus]|uniref:Lrp/AsnC family transcriptional regulator n=1 Tax=Phycicoccus endophyticus TaxID=1690220 RepID=A0A7G9QZU4_9MICO|nr:Lrp/AsnC family transcriptional regulator [Phycicoccus endophyticus]NHI20069.1 Lrp/AsnC family transcriptional regulator [Phycicoccus endophyticus]QNN48869.1 Lrp/AsnC family transcriptional regulator [Phycicoccus endophyticus]GGL45672.1 transcriptional regulator [Phycicoccus endophyticus]